jgi:uncharacterized protein
MTEGMYFFDTYALVEVLESHASYSSFSKCKALVTKLNLFELYTYLYRGGLDDNSCDRILAQYRSSCIDYGFETLQKAAKMKMQNKKLSMADCIGYQAACEYGVRFLTGDKEFEGMPNVEFVK